MWLYGHRGMVADFFKAFRSQLPTGIAIDAGRIDIKISRYIRSKPFVLISHGPRLYGVPFALRAFDFPRSTARQRYHAAAVRWGLHRSPYFNIYLGVGSAGRR